MVLGDALLRLKGYESVGAEPIPLGRVALAGLAAVLVLITPTIPATMRGLRARRLGVTSGILPAIIGAAALGYGLLTNTLPLLLASLGR